MSMLFLDGDAAVASSEVPTLQHLVVLSVGTGLHVFRSLDSIKTSLSDALSTSRQREERTASATAEPAVGPRALHGKAGQFNQHTSDYHDGPGSDRDFARLRLSTPDSDMRMPSANSSWESMAAQHACSPVRGEVSRSLSWLASVPTMLAGAAASEVQRHHHQPRFAVSLSARSSAAQEPAVSTSRAGAASERHRSKRQQQQQEPAAATAATTITTSAARTLAACSSAPAWLQAATVAAGAASRTLAQVAIHPLDTLKTRMQVSIPAPQLQVWRAVMSSAASCAATRRAALLAWTGPAGARDLFLGLSGAVAGTLPSAALFFATEAAARPALAGLMGCEADAAPARLLASAAAAAASALIRVPADVLKHRVQAYVYPSVTAAARDIVARRGVAGLYAGFGATLLRDAPELVIQFTAYTQIKALLHKASSQDNTHGASSSHDAAQQEKQQAGGPASSTAAAVAEHLAVGGAAGAAAALATTPLDVIKTQLQCGGASSVGGAVAAAMRSGGGNPAALFAGLGPRLLQTTLCSALFFTCYEASKVRLGQMAAAQQAQEAQQVQLVLRAAQLEAQEAATAAAAAAAVSRQQGSGRFWRRRRNNGSSSGSASDLWETRAELPAA